MTSLSFSQPPKFDFRQNNYALSIVNGDQVQIGAKSISTTDETADAKLARIAKIVRDLGHLVKGNSQLLDNSENRIQVSALTDALKSFITADPALSSLSDRVLAIAATVESDDDASVVQEPSTKRRRLHAPESKEKPEREERKQAAAPAGASSSSSAPEPATASLQGMPRHLRKHIASFVPSATEFAALQTDKRAPSGPDMWKGRDKLVEKALCFVDGDIDELTDDQWEAFDAEGSTIKALDLSSCFITDQKLALILEFFPNLESLSLTGRLYEPQSAVLLSKMPSLRRLDLGRCTQLPDNILENLGKLPLTELHLTLHYMHADVVAPQIAKMTHLQVLDLAVSTTSNTTVAQLALLPELRELSLNASHISDRAAVNFAKMAHLQALFLPNSHITNETIPQLIHLPLTTLNLAYSYITNASAPEFAKMTELRTLNLFGCIGISNDMVFGLAELQLRELHLANTRVNNDVIPAIILMKSLREIDLSETGVTKAGIEKLRKERPNLRISY